MSHANAALTPHHRLKLARLIVDQAWPVAPAAERYDVSWPTAKRWAVADRGVIVQRVVSDSGSAYKSLLWRDTCAELGITAKKTRPYRPQTNGKICEDLASIHR